MDNFKLIFDEFKNENKKIIVLVLKNTNNYLLKLLGSENIIQIKKEPQVKIIEVEKDYFDNDLDKIMLNWI